MARQPTPTCGDDAPKLSDVELAEFRPVREVMSEAEFKAAASAKRGRPAVAEPKVPVTIRPSRAVVETYKATGKGWQTRMNADLEKTAIRWSAGSRQRKEGDKASPTSTAPDTSAGTARLTFHRQGAKKIG